MSKEDIEIIRQNFPTGTKVCIIKCQTDVPLGATGSINDVENDGTINVKLDNNGPVKIRFGTDLFQVL